VQKNTGSVSFSDSCSHKRSAVQNINTKMDVLIKCMNLKQSNSAVTQNTTVNFSIKILEDLEIKRMNYIAAYKRIHLTSSTV